ncbi:MAG: hypothetical protein SVR94_03735 [Pseudomonadota bacterium]|nr:hypothetical protein [Pseudomonadota bacterium]
MKNLLRLLLLMILLTLFGCSSEDETADSQETQNEQDNAFTVEPFKPASEATQISSSEETQAAAKPKVSSETIAFTKAAITTTATQKSPRISIIGPKGTQIALKVFFDNQPICTLNGRIDAKTHRSLEEHQFIVDGACHSEQMATQGQHEYRLSGRIRLPEGEPQEVSVTSGQHDMNGVIEPLVIIDAQGKIRLQLGVG